MSLTDRGSGSAVSGTTNCTPAWVTGNPADLILILSVRKPFGSASTVPAGFTALAAATSGSVASSASDGSVKTDAFYGTTRDPATGSQNITSAGGANVILAKAVRLGATTGQFSVLGIALADTSETLVTVSATGTGAAGDFAAGDKIVLNVGIKDDTPNHTTQTLTIPGCTLTLDSWDTKTGVTTGDDAGQYVGHFTVATGPSTAGTITYAATSSVSGAAATAVNLVRIREAPARSLLPDDRRVRRNSLLRR